MTAKVDVMMKLVSQRQTAILHKPRSTLCERTSDWGLFVATLLQQFLACQSTTVRLSLLPSKLARLPLHSFSVVSF